MRGLILVFAFLLGIAAPAAGAEPVVPINDLVEQAKVYDGKTVTVEGEVIGDVMIRGRDGWVNISDGTNDLGVWAQAEQLRQIRFAGRYHTVGDKVRVTGTFFRADPEAGGDLDIRAVQLEVLQAGGPVERPVPPGRTLLAMASLGVATALGLILRSRTRAYLKRRTHSA